MTDEGTNDRGDRQRARRAEIARIWGKLFIPTANKKKKAFQKDADEVDRYFTSNHDHLYQELSKWLDPEDLFCLTVNLAFEIRGYLAPHLYHKNPVRTVLPLTRDPVWVFAAHVADVYLNYTPNENLFKEEMRAAIDDALLPGRACAWTEVDRTTGLIHTKQVPIDDVVIDADARCVKEAQWIGVRIQEPLYVVKKRFGTPANELKANVISEAAATAADEGPPSDELAQVIGHTTDLVRYYEIYSKFGVGLARGKGAGKEFRKWEDKKGEPGGKRFKKLVIVIGHDQPLFEGDWDIPLHLDDDWPFEFMDFTPTRKGSKQNPLWPVSLMKAGLGHQKAIDFLATLLMEKLKILAKTIFGVMADKDSSVVDELTDGSLHPVVRLDPNDAGMKIQDILQVLNLGKESLPTAFFETLLWHEQKFGEVTGLLPILKGAWGVGQGAGGEGQMRSAKEAEMRDRNSRSRLEDMSERVETFATGIARREALAIRLAPEGQRGHSLEKVATAVEGKLEQEWWKVKVLLGGKEYSVLELREGVFPSAGTYFQSEREAAQVAGGLKAGEPHTRIAWETKYPGEIWSLQLNVVKVTVEELWFDTAGVTGEDLARELKARVEAGTARRPDWNLKHDQAAIAMEHVGVRALEQFGDVDTFNKALDFVWDAVQVPRAQRIYMDAEFVKGMQQQQAQAAQQEQQQGMQIEGAKLQAAQQGKATDAMSKLEQIQAKGRVDASLAVVTAAAKKEFDPPGGGGVR